MFLWWEWKDSNLHKKDLQSPALPVAPHSHFKAGTITNSCLLGVCSLILFQLRKSNQRFDFSLRSIRLASKKDQFISLSQLKNTLFIFFVSYYPYSNTDD